MGGGGVMIRAACKAPSPLGFPDPSVCSLLSEVCPNHPEQLRTSSKAWLWACAYSTAIPKRGKRRGVADGVSCQSSSCDHPAVRFPWLSAALSPRAGFGEGKTLNGSPETLDLGQLIKGRSFLLRISWVLRCSCHVPGPVGGRCWGPPAGPSGELTRGGPVTLALASPVLPPVVPAKF